VVNAIISGTTVAVLGLANMLGRPDPVRSPASLNANARSPLFPELPTLAEAGSGIPATGSFTAARRRSHHRQATPKSRGRWRRGLVRRTSSIVTEPAVNTPGTGTTARAQVAERIAWRRPAADDARYCTEGH
jgi:hypothetical protein